MKNFIFFLFISYHFVGCSNLSSIATNNTEKKELKKFIINYYDAMSNRNWPLYQEFFAQNAILTTLWKESENSEPTIFTNSITEFLAETKNGPDSQPIFEERPILIDIEVKNNLAKIWVKYEAKFGNNKDLLEWKGYDLFSLIKHKGKWKITSLTYSEL